VETRRSIEIEVQQDEAPAARSRFALRAPLMAKLLVSYLLVLALVLVPAYLILRGRAQSEVRGVLQHELAAQVALLGQRLGAAPVLQPRVDELLRTVPVRVTVIDLRGQVLGDSAAQATEMENHLKRPEIQQALREGSGSAVRHSATTGQTMIYAARRFPESGPARGVVRLSLPTSRADQAADDGMSSLDRAAAAALSLALVLSLIAAILVSRPLRRIARGARALAAGDLGHVVAIRSHDELGQVTAALEELAAQLRVRLLESGADHMTLRALLDDLPIGAILYGPDLVPVVMNGAARALLELSPASEMDDARRLIERPEQAAAVGRVLDGRLCEEQSLVPPGKKKPLRARWIAVARADGGAQPALLLWRDEEEPRRELAASVRRWGDLLRESVHEVRDPATARKLAQALVEMDRTRPDERPGPNGVEPVLLARLCELPLRAARAQAAPDISVALDLADPEVLVVESGGRVDAALRRLLTDAIAASEPGATLRLRGEQEQARVRLSMRLRVPARGSFKTRWVASQVACLGGDAGTTRDGDELEVWLSLPRA
jgi:two-component system, OmpR family, phosphate regulon sensor histidine kinase PhoR